jgi:hypothetical protein
MNLFPSFLRGDTAAGWRSRNPILPAGVFGFEQVDTYTARAKVGNGKARWNDLAYFNGASAALASPAPDMDGGGA